MTELKRCLTVLHPLPTRQEAPQQPHSNAYSVLVLNSNREMANEITYQLSQEVDECTIIYAPTIELAKLLLKKHYVDLIVSTPLLPDGHITKLHSFLKNMEHAPDLVIFANDDRRGLLLLDNPEYHFLSVKQTKSSTDYQLLQNLSQDLRDSLNNPLQEIVALVFVARTTPVTSGTDKALTAIEKAAQKMAGIVWGIEEQLYQNIMRSNSHLISKRLTA